MGTDIKLDEQLRKARAQLHEVNLDLKLERLHGDLVVIAVEREAGHSRPLKGVPPLPYPSAELAQWIGDITARVTRS